MILLGKSRLSNAISIYTTAFERQASSLRDRFERIASYRDDWDDEGAPALNPELIRRAREILDQIIHAAEEQDGTLPNELSALSTGAVVIGWRFGSEYVEWEISQPNEIHEMVVSPGIPTEHRVIPWPPKNLSGASAIEEVKQLAA